MNVLVWTFDTFQRNYSSYHLYEGLISALLSKGHRVTLVQVDMGISPSVPDHFKNNELFHEMGIPFDMKRSAGLKHRYIAEMQYTLKAFRRIKRCGRFDVALVQSHNTAGVALSLLKLINIPSVYNEQDIFPLNAVCSGLLKKGLVYAVASRISGAAYKYCSKVITISGDMAREIVRIGCNECDVCVVPNWCRNDVQYILDDENNAFYATHIAPYSDKFCAIYAGNVGRMQNVAAIVEAAELLVSEPIQFFIVGSGNCLQGLKEYVSSRSLNNVVFCDGVSNSRAHEVYASADLNLIPLKSGVISTCMPSKTAVCVYARRPFVATIEQNTWAADVINAVPYGYVVPPDNPTALAEKIVALMKQFGRRCLAERDTASENMFNEGNALEYVKVLEEVCSSSNTHARSRRERQL